MLPLLALFVLLALLLVGSRARRPVIDAAEPRIARGGDPLIVTGRNFGSERNGAYVVIAGVTPSSTAYLEWRDDRISVRVPDEVRSGFVQVVAGGVRSNGVLFANRDYLPMIRAGPAAAGEPLIDAPDPPQPAAPPPGRLPPARQTRTGVARSAAGDLAGDGRGGSAGR